MFNSARVSNLLFAFAADFYVATIAARFVARFWPTVRNLTFSAIFLSLAAIDIAALIVQAQRGKHSTLTILLIHLGFFFTGLAVVLIVGGLVEGKFANDWGTIADSWGVMFWGTYVISSLRNSFHAQKLETDIESSSASIEEDRKALHKYHHPYT